MADLQVVQVTLRAVSKHESGPVEGLWSIVVRPQQHGRGRRPVDVQNSVDQEVRLGRGLGHPSFHAWPDGQGLTRANPHVSDDVVRLVGQAPGHRRVADHQFRTVHVPGRHPTRWRAVQIVAPVHSRRARTVSMILNPRSDQLRIGRAPPVVSHQLHEGVRVRIGIGVEVLAAEVPEERRVGDRHVRIGVTSQVHAVVGVAREGAAGDGDRRRARAVDVQAVSILLCRHPDQRERGTTAGIDPAIGMSDHHVVEIAHRRTLKDQAGPVESLGRRCIRPEGHGRPVDAVDVERTENFKPEPRFGKNLDARVDGQRATGADIHVTRHHVRASGHSPGLVAGRATHVRGLSGTDADRRDQREHPQQRNPRRVPFPETTNRRSDDCEHFDPLHSGRGAAAASLVWC